MAKQKTKPAAKPAKKAGAADSERELLAKELKGLIPKLDGEGLVFLIEQARVHIYNMQVDELNRAAIAAEASAPTAAAKTRSAAGKCKTQVKPGSARKGYSIAGSESGSSFYLYCPNDEIMFSRDEMGLLIKIVNGKGTDLEIRERLFNWIERERRDVFAAISIANKFDDNLKMLAALIKKSFKTSR
jgi:hypothetical protein